MTMVYSLWHIPSSTLLVSTGERHEVESRIQCVLSNGYAVDDLMLQVTGQDELLGHQHLGGAIGEVIHLEMPGACLESGEPQEKTVG